MTMKGAVQQNHIPVNNYELKIQGQPVFLFTKISGLDQETESVDLPDRTVASGGNVKAFEITAESFEHHAVETDALEAWRQEGKDNVTRTYKKTGTLIKRAIDGTVQSSRILTGVWVKKRKDADLDLANEGEPAMIEWTLSVDDAQTL